MLTNRLGRRSHHGWDEAEWSDEQLVTPTAYDADYNDDDRYDVDDSTDDWYDDAGYAEDALGDDAVGYDDGDEDRFDVELEPIGRQRSLRRVVLSRTGLRVGIALTLGLIVAAVIGSRGSGAVDTSTHDPSTGYEWCLDDASDFLGDPVGDTYGWENGKSCRVRYGSYRLDMSIPTPPDEQANPPPVEDRPEPGPPTTGNPLPTPAPSPTTSSTIPPEDGGGQPPVDDPAPEPDPTEPDPGDGGGNPGQPPSVAPINPGYDSNLAMIRNQRIRNRNEDDSAYRNTPSAQLNPSNHYGPRSDYLNNPGGNPEQSFPVANGGQFRVGCEFSHFAYDDPIVYPGQPGASHLHMFFGNTDVNAYSTYETLIDSGSSTCNGQELNRTGYWVPALFDDKGNARVPERVVVYYKGEGLARGGAEMFPERAAMVSKIDLNTVGTGSGGAAGKFSFTCSDNYSGMSQPASNTMPSCDGSRFRKAYGSSDPHVVLEMNVKFPQCWNGKDPSNPANFSHPSEGSWYYSLCNGEFNHTLVNLEYFVNYRVEEGESTAGWFLSSDVNPSTLIKSSTSGSTIHADWWGAWHKQTNQMWLDNCVNYKGSSPSGCGFGYLTDGGSNGSSPSDGPALRYREQYTGPTKVSAAQLYRELCPIGGDPVSPAAAAYCTPG